LRRENLGGSGTVQIAGYTPRKPMFSFILIQALVRSRLRPGRARRCLLFDVCAASGHMQLAVRQVLGVAMPSEAFFSPPLA